MSRIEAFSWLHCRGIVDLILGLIVSHLARPNLQVGCDILVAFDRFGLVHQPLFTNYVLPWLFPQPYLAACAFYSSVQAL